MKDFWTYPPKSLHSLLVILGVKYNLQTETMIFLEREKQDTSEKL